MPGTTAELTTTVETYLTALRRIRATGGAAGERSYYGPLAKLPNAVQAAINVEMGGLFYVPVEISGKVDNGITRNSSREGCGISSVQEKCHILLDRSSKSC